LGAALIMVSAVGFGAMAIFGKLAYDDGVGTLTLLLVRFVLGTVVFAVLLAARRERLPRHGLRAGFALGAIGYATQAGLYFAALHHLDASLLALVLYTYPAWVTVAGLLLGRDRPSRRRLAALGLASTGLVIVLVAAGTGGFDPLGAVLGLASSLAYTAYILVADDAGPSMSPVALSALVCAGAATTFAVAGVASGRLDWGFQAQGWLWLAAIAVVSTALPIATFFAGLARVGPSAAAIISTLEPVVTVGLAYLAFSETLSAVQLAGAALVLAAAVLLARPAPA
jgi:drug/metabolite transporter (DMT)-like permease